MKVISTTEGRRLAEQTPYAEAILRLDRNPLLAVRCFDPPFRYATHRYRSGGAFSNCCGTIAYVSRTEDGIKDYWTPERARQKSPDGESYIAFPRLELNRPGFVSPAFMQDFLQYGNSFARISGETMPGDVVTFRDRDHEMHDAAVLLGVLHGCNVLFYQTATGRPFRFGTIEEYQAAIENAVGECDFDIWRKVN